MNILEMIKIGSNFLREKKIPSHILDSEILLSKTLKIHFFFLIRTMGTVLQWDTGKILSRSDSPFLRTPDTRR